MTIVHNHHRSQKRRSITVFVFKNYPLLLLTALILGGILLGGMMYSAISNSDIPLSDFFIPDTQTITSMADGCVAVFKTAFQMVLLLIVLFLFGMTPYGVPLVLAIMIAFGVYLGAMECSHYDNGGLYRVLTTAIPYIIFSASAVMIAGAQAIRMSCLFSRQLLPFSAHCGSLWHDFKLYLLRYLICLVLAFAAAVCEVIANVFC